MPNDEGADPAQADDAGGLLVELDAGVLAALPLPLLEGGVGRRDVPGRRQQQPDRELGGADDVRLRGVDDHDAGEGGRLDVHVVEADPCAGHHLEVARRGQRLGVHLGGAADEQGVRVGQGGQQRGPVRAVDLPDLEVRPEGLDGGGRELFGDEHDWLGHGHHRRQRLVNGFTSVHGLGRTTAR